MLRLLVLLAVLFLPAMPVSAETLVYFGTYTGGSSEGIYVSRLENGTLTPPVLAAEIENPSFVAIAPSGRHLYSVIETGDGAVAAFTIEADGTLTKLNQLSAGGGGTCYVSVTPDGRTVLAANYGGGSVASFRVAEDGSLAERTAFHQHTGSSGVVTNRQEAPHAHAIVPSPDGSFAFVPDLGLDQIKAYRIAESALVPAPELDVATPPGGGPRHLAFSPDGSRAFVNLEMGNQLVAYDYAGGRFTQTAVVSTVPENHTGGGTAECLVHPDGKTVYVTNRGHDSVAVFEATPLKWTQTINTRGKIPRGAGLTPDGRFFVLCNQKSDTAYLLDIAEDGSLAFDEQPAPLSIGTPVNARVLVRD